MKEFAIIQHLATTLQGAITGDGLDEIILRSLLQEQHNIVVGQSRQELETMKATITTLYDNQKWHWENYLTPEGVVQYIRQLTKCTLEFV